MELGKGWMGMLIMVVIVIAAVVAGNYAYTAMTTKKTNTA
jgi:hypothetical protein